MNFRIQLHLLPSQCGNSVFNTIKRIAYIHCTVKNSVAQAATASVADLLLHINVAEVWPGSGHTEMWYG
jgi:hypothetical protein